MSALQAGFALTGSEKAALVPCGILMSLRSAVVRQRSTVKGGQTLDLNNRTELALGRRGMERVL